MARAKGKAEAPSKTGPMAILAWLVGLVVGFLEWAWRTARVAYHVNRIPGPWALPLIGNLHQLGAVRKPYPFMFHRTRAERIHMREANIRKIPMNRWMQAYKPMFRVWLGPAPLVIICGSEPAKAIMGPSGPNAKSPLYRFILPWLQTGLLTSKGDKWRSRRRMITPSFHFEMLRVYHAVFEKHARALCRSIDGEGDGKAFHVYPKMTHVALDIISECATGTCVEALRDGDNKYVAATYETLELIFERMFKPWLWPDLVYPWTPSGRRAKRALGILHAHTHAVIERRRRELFGADGAAGSGKGAGAEARGRAASLPTGCENFLDVLLTAKDEAGNPLDDASVAEEVDTFMFEGHDTTSAAMTWAVYLIGTHPEVQKRVHAEVDEVLGGGGEGGTGAPHDVPTIDDIKRMPYLEACVMEALRCLGSVPFIGRLIEQDTVVDGHLLPAGVEVILPPMAVHTNESEWPEPWEYKPERFLDKSESNPDGKSHNNFAFVPFSAGPRGCIGRNFALNEEKVVLSTLFRRYSFAVPYEQAVYPSFELILKPARGELLVTATRRTHAAGGAGGAAE